uniref:Uncharacterized protein n=1 Tax=Vespula pensylvanica TaxID=30213 RepID=A0A834UEG4_VESPE|nr:hypothetical protein H0235_002582 [Vespula pensylvanica]
MHFMHLSYRKSLMKIYQVYRYIELHGGNARPFKRGKASVRMRVVNAIMEEEASKVFEGWLDFDFDNDYDEEKEEEEEKLVKEVKEEEEEGSDRLWISECQSTSSSRLALLHRSNEEYEDKVLLLEGVISSRKKQNRGYGWLT